jgi:hypothetical protein
VKSRIQELAEQAGVFEYKKYYDPTYSEFISNKDKVEKFAELIVRECADIALREDHDPSDCILSHFGLKR